MKRQLSLLSALALLAAGPAVGQDAVRARTETAWGLRTTTFETRQGSIAVNLPDDTSRGDTVSGTVIAEPSGATEAERRGNGDALDGCVVELEGAKTPVGGKTLSWTVPAALTAATLILRNRGGEEMSRIQVPVLSTPPPAPESFALPGIGQAGRPLAIPGPFDGKRETTGVTVGGREAVLLAESERKVVCESPTDIVGPTEIALREGDVTAQGKLNNLALSLSLPVRTLPRGQSATLDVRVSGLEGLERSVSLRVQNDTPEVVRLGDVRGDVVWRIITPREVGEGGVYPLPIRLTGVSPGRFRIAATVTPENPEHVKVLSNRETHSWEISSLPTHSVSDSDQEPHRVVFSQREVHDPDLSSVPPHEPAISGKKGRDHRENVSKRRSHEKLISKREVHAPALSKSGQPPHDPRLSKRPRHDEDRSKSTKK